MHAENATKRDRRESWQGFNFICFVSLWWIAQAASIRRSLPFWREKIAKQSNELRQTKKKSSKNRKKSFFNCSFDWNLSWQLKVSPFGRRGEFRAALTSKSGRWTALQLTVKLKKMLSTNPALFEGFQVHTITAELFSAQFVCANSTLQGFITLSCSLGFSVSKWSHRVGEIALACFLSCTSWLRCSHFHNDMVIRVSWSKTFFFAFRSPSWNSGGSDRWVFGTVCVETYFYSSFTALASRTSTDYSWNNGDTTVYWAVSKNLHSESEKCFSFPLGAWYFQLENKNKIFFNRQT